MDNSWFKYGRNRLTDLLKTIGNSADLIKDIEKEIDNRKCIAENINYVGIF